MDELKPKHIQAIAAILTTSSLTEAADKVGLTERTLYKWMTEIEFRTALYAEEDRIIDQAVRHLLTLSERALSTFDDILTKEGVNDNTKLRAAALVMENLLRLRELQTIDARLRELEERANL